MSRIPVSVHQADTDVILQALDQAPWRDKEMVQVFIKEQEEEVFRLPYRGGFAEKIDQPR